MDALLKNEDYLNQLVQIGMKEYNIVLISIPEDQILFFPESGFFQFPVKDNASVTGFTFCYAFLIPQLGNSSEAL